MAAPSEYHVVRTYARVEPGLVEQFREVGVASVHEAQEKRGAMDAGIKPIYPGLRLLGTALTVRCQPGDNLMLHKALDIVQPGEVIVCDIGGWQGGPWGELTTVSALARGCSGLVIDGFVRDGRRIRELAFPVFSRGLSVNGTFKEHIGLVNHPISCGGVIVRAGDLLLGDDDGVCVVQREAAPHVLEKVRQRDELEARLRSRFEAGETFWSVSGFGELARSKGLVEEPL